MDQRTGASAVTLSSMAKSGTNTVVLPAPWSLCLVSAAAGIAALILGTFGSWLLLPILWIVWMALIYYFGRPWARQQVSPIYEKARSEGRPKPYVRLTFPWRQTGSPVG